MNIGMSSVWNFYYALGDISVKRRAVHERPANLTLGCESTKPEQAIFIASSIFLERLSLHDSAMSPNIM
jgi:hypothetical protein